MLSFQQSVVRQPSVVKQQPTIMVARSSQPTIQSMQGYGQLNSPIKVLQPQTPQRPLSLVQSVGANQLVKNSNFNQSIQQQQSQQSQQQLQYRTQVVPCVLRHGLPYGYNNTFLQQKPSVVGTNAVLSNYPGVYQNFKSTSNALPAKPLGQNNTNNSSKLNSQRNAKASTEQNQSQIKAAPNQNQNQASSAEMVKLIKDNQDLKAQISKLEEEMSNSKNNIDRLKELIEYMQKENESKKSNDENQQIEQNGQEFDNENQENDGQQYDDGQNDEYQGDDFLDGQQSQ